MNEKNRNKSGIISFAWEEIQREYKQYVMKYPEVIFYEEKFELFSSLFDEKYDDIKKRFMKEGTKALDPHKQAALLTICCLESNVIEHNLKNTEQISIVPQLIAITVGLRYMLDCLNKKLIKAGIIKKINEYYFPIAIACDTQYIEIMSRLLYYEQHESDMSYNVLELSDRYFLLEYITLIQRRIEPSLLKD